ncbi:hypothetical protein ACWDZ8_35915 [Streptomyces sp. NPDC003233]
MTQQDTIAGAPEYEFMVADKGDLNAAQLLRVVRYAPRFPGSDPWYLDDERDQGGTVFLMRRAGRAVATLRILPVDSGNSELAALRPLPEGLSGLAGTWELGRVAALNADGGHPPYMPLLFTWGARWAQQHLPLERIVAYCTRGRLAGFARLGAEPVDGPYDLPGKGEAYYTIRAELDTVLDRAHQLGITAFLDTVTIPPGGSRDPLAPAASAR